MFHNIFPPASRKSMMLLFSKAHESNALMRESLSMKSNDDGLGESYSQNCPVPTARVMLMQKS